MTTAVLILAFLVDLAIGDPRWLPHPVRIIGKAIQRCESFLRSRFTRPSDEKKAGLILVAMIVAPSFILTFALQKAIFLVSDRISPNVGLVLFVWLTASTIALGDLTDSARRVIESVKDGSLSAARRKLSMIVGRDTENLSEKDVLRAVIETLSENLSDGIIAPLFYLVIGGLPLAMTYKAINTLDSMVGYKSDRYINFGWASARLDDLANFIPARISGFLIVLSVFIIALFQRGRDPLAAADQAFRTMVRDGRNHTSPNSGVPEAAMAGAVGVRLGGPSAYGGVLVEKPYIGYADGDDYLSASEDAIIIIQSASVIGVAVAATLLSFGSGF